MGSIGSFDDESYILVAVDVGVKVDFVDSVEFIKHFSHGYIVFGIVLDLLPHVFLVIWTSIQDLALEYM